MSNFLSSMENNKKYYQRMLHDIKRNEEELVQLRRFADRQRARKYPKRNHLAKLSREMKTMKEKIHVRAAFIASCTNRVDLELREVADMKARCIDDGRRLDAQIDEKEKYMRYVHSGDYVKDFQEKNRAKYNQLMQKRNQSQQLRLKVDNLEGAVIRNNAENKAKIRAGKKQLQELQEKIRNMIDEEAADMDPYSSQEDV